MKISLFLKVSLGCVLALQVSARAQVSSSETPLQPFQETERPQVVLESAESPVAPVDIDRPVVENEDPLIRVLNQELDRRAGLSQETPAANGADSVPASRPSGAEMFIRMIWALAIVLGLLFLIFYVLRRVGRKTPLLAGPSLGKVLGRVHLTRNSSLHFVKTADRVLVVGVTDNGISLVSDFDAALFEGSLGADEGGEAYLGDDFLAQLRTSSRAMAPVTGAMTSDDDEITSLRGDIGRLQQYLQDEQGERPE